MADASYPDDLLYHPEHDWARIDGDDRRRSASPGSPRTRWARSCSSTRRRRHHGHRGESYAEVESVKAVSDVIAPLSRRDRRGQRRRWPTRPRRSTTTPMVRGGWSR